MRTDPATLNSLRSIDFRRILLIKPSALGDVIHTVPVLAKLRRRYPRAHIDWLLTPNNAELIRRHPALSGVVDFSRQQFARFGRSRKATVGVLQLLRDLRRARYDLVIDMHGQLRSALLVFATGAPVRIGFDKPVPRTRSVSDVFSLQNVPKHGWAGAREGSWISYTHRIPIPTLDVHAIDRYLWIGEMLGFDTEPPDQTLYLPEAAEERISELLGVLDRAEELAVLVPGTMWETKHWTTGSFAVVANALISKGISVVIAGAQCDIVRCEQISNLCPEALNLCGKTSTAELGALIRRARLCVTNDSGSMHLAVAMNTAVVSIFGPTNPIHIGPYGSPRSVVRADLPCSPCNLRRLSKCPHDHQCMDRITPQIVIDRIEEILG